MKRPTTVFTAALLLCLPPICVAEPGNLISWFSNSQNELTFTCQTAVVRLSMLDTNVARVRQTPTNVPFSIAVSFTVVKNWPLPPMSVADGGNTLTITSAGLRVDVSKTPFRFTFRKPDGTILLSDTNTFGLGIGPGAASVNFNMPANEQYYGGGLIEGYPLSYRGQHRTLYNSYASFQGGFMPNLPVPLIVSSKGYGVFVDNTFSQDWDFNNAAGTQWLIVVRGGEMNYYFIAGNSIAGVLDSYTQMTGRAPMPPRWTSGYVQSKYGYRNWNEVHGAQTAFRTKDLPCDALVLDYYWFGQGNQMGGLQWDSNNFPDPSTNIAALGSDGFKVMAIHEPYINSQNQPALANFQEAASLKYMMADNYPARNIPSTVNGWYGNAGYLDLNNPAARAWWFGKLKHIIDDGVAAHWTDLGEPEEDDTTDYSYDGRREAELHNVYSLLWHKALDEGYATNYPNQRLFQFSRAGFAGDQRYGTGHWTSDAQGNWETLAAHPNALANYGLSGLNLFGSDIGGYAGTPSDELYVRWFQFGAFCPVFRAHGVNKPVAPYEFSSFVEDSCRTMLKLRYRLAPYLYTTHRATYETGLPVCRALPLAFPNDALVLPNGTQFMFGPSIMVAPVTSQGLVSRSIYLPAGKWIDHWSGQALAGPVTTNWPAPMSQIPFFYADNSIIPLGPFVASTQFDDGSQRTLRIQCSSSASYTLYDDDGSSNGYRSNQFATTQLSASVITNAVYVQIGGAVGTYSNRPSQRTWGLEIFCTNAVRSVIADGANANYYSDGAQNLLRIKLPAGGITQPHTVTAYLNLSAPMPFEARINCGGRPYLDSTGAMWTEDRTFEGGRSNIVPNAIQNTPDPILHQSEHLGASFNYRLDCPTGLYEIQVLNAETYWTAAGRRLFNLSLNGTQVLTNFDIFAAAGGANKAITSTFTNPVANGQLLMEFTGVATAYEVNARVSAIRVRKIADLNPLDSVGDGIPNWWRAFYFGGTGTTTNNQSCAECDPDGDGRGNAQEFLAGTSPTVAAPISVIGSVTNVTYSVDATNGNTTAYFWIRNGGVVQVAPYASDAARVRFSWTTLLAKEDVAVAKPFSQWPTVTTTISDTPGTNFIQTADLIIEVIKKPNFQIHFLDRNQGYALSSDDHIEYNGNYQPLNDSSYATVHCCGTPPNGFKLKAVRTMPGDEAYFGLGENTGALNRRGQAIQCWNSDDYAWGEGQNPLYMSLPFFYGVRPASGGRPTFAYGIFFNNPSRPFFKMGTEFSDRYSFEAADGQVDYFFFGGGAGHTMRAVLDRYSELTGRPAMLPKWALGYQSSRWSYDNQSWVESLSGEYRNQDFPLDAIYLDIDYMDVNHDNNYSDGTCHQLTFNEWFPDSAGMIAVCASHGVKLVPILEPWITTQDTKWTEGNTGQYFVKNNDGSTLVSATGFFGDLSWIDFSKTGARNWWKSRVISFLNAFPFAGLWNDLNEPADHDAVPLNALFWLDGRFGFNPGDSRQWYLSEKNPYCVRETSLSYQILQEKYPARRPFVVSRAGWPGIQRYAVGWTGDTRSSWDAIRYLIPVGLSTMISGQANFGSDIGGFVGSPSGELMTRWHEWGVLNPLCRNHSQKSDIEREPWRFGEPYTSLMRNNIKFRYRLLPYLYTLAHQSTVDGMPMNSPTVFHFTGDANTYSQNNNDFMVGDWLFAAPVWISGASTRSAYLPAGTDWYYWPTGAKYTGGQTVNVNAPLGTLPLFVRAGAIIPMGPAMQYVDQFTADYLDINCWPQGNSSFTLYEDAGEGWSFTNGVYGATTFTSSRTVSNWNFTVSARQGSYNPGARTFNIYVYNPAAVQRVILNGLALNQLPDLKSAAPGWLMTGDGKLAIRVSDTGAPQSIRVDWAGPDSVGDGIPDWWRAQYFGGTGQTTNNQSCASCDSDGDATGNMGEYLAGTIPTDQSSAFRIASFQPSGNDMIVTFASVIGRKYRVERRDNMNSGTWTTLADNIAGTGALIAMNDPGARTQPRRFYRIMILPN